MLYEISGYIAPRCNGTGQYVRKYMYMRTVYPHCPVIHICIFLKTYNCICQIQKKENILSIMSDLQPNRCLKIDFQNVDQHAGGKWLIHDTKRRKDNQLQSLKLTCRISKLSI